MVEKGRAPTGDKHGSRTKPERLARGGRNGATKLTEDLVRKIREEYALGGITQQVLADEYVVSKGTIYNIIHKKKWAHVS
jgi:hypothetical protein